MTVAPSTWAILVTIVLGVGVLVGVAAYIDYQREIETDGTAIDVEVEDA